MRQGLDQSIFRLPFYTAYVSWVPHFLGVPRRGNPIAPPDDAWEFDKIAIAWRAKHTAKGKAYGV